MLPSWFKVMNQPVGLGSTGDLNGSHGGSWPACGS